MIRYKICINNGIEAFGIDHKTITVCEELKKCDENALAREINHENPLIPEQVAKSVLDNFCKAALNLMSMGYSVYLKNGDDVAIRIYPDVNINGGNINIDRARELDPSVAELTEDNAGELVSKAGVSVRIKAECQHKFIKQLQTEASLMRTDVVERAKKERKA